MAQKWQKIPKMAQGDPNMTQNGPKRVKMVQEWSKMTQNGPKMTRTFSANFFDWKGGSANFFAFRMYVWNVVDLVEQLLPWWGIPLEDQLPIMVKEQPFASFFTQFCTVRHENLVSSGETSKLGLVLRWRWHNTLQSACLAGTLALFSGFSFFMVFCELCKA